MTLHYAFGNPNLQVPIKVIGNGNGISNVPKGFTATVIAIDVNTCTYKIRWDHNGQVEEKSTCGSLSMNLDLEQSK